MMVWPPLLADRLQIGRRRRAGPDIGDLDEDLAQQIGRRLDIFDDEIGKVGLGCDAAHDLGRAFHRIVGDVRELLMRRQDFQLEIALFEARNAGRHQPELATLRGGRLEAEIGRFALVIDGDDMIQELHLRFGEIDLEFLRVMAELVDESDSARDPLPVASMVGLRCSLAGQAASYLLGVMARAAWLTWKPMAMSLLPVGIGVGSPTTSRLEPCWQMTPILYQLSCDCFHSTGRRTGFIDVMIVVLVADARHIAERRRQGGLAVLAEYLVMLQALLRQLLAQVAAGIARPRAEAVIAHRDRPPAIHVDLLRGAMVDSGGIVEFIEIGQRPAA